MIKLQLKICIINVMNCLIMRQIEKSVLKLGADNHYRFPEFSSGRLVSNKWNGVWNTNTLPWYRFHKIPLGDLWSRLPLDAMACLHSYVKYHTKCCPIFVLCCYYWWTASTKPRLLFSRAGYAFWGFFLSSVYYVLVTYRSMFILFNFYFQCYNNCCIYFINWKHYYISSLCRQFEFKLLLLRFCY